MRPEGLSVRRQQVVPFHRRSGMKTLPRQVSHTWSDSPYQNPVSSPRTVYGDLTRTLSNKEFLELLRKLLGETCSGFEVQRSETALHERIEHDASYTDDSRDIDGPIGLLRAPITTDTIGGNTSYESPGLIVLVCGIYTGDASADSPFGHVCQWRLESQSIVRSKGPLGVTANVSSSIRWRL